MVPHRGRWPLSGTTSAHGSECPTRLTRQWSRTNQFESKPQLRSRCVRWASVPLDGAQGRGPRLSFRLVQCRSAPFMAAPQPIAAQCPVLP